MIILYGKLRQQFGKTIGATVHSVRELMQAAEANRPGFTAAIDKGRKYIIRRGSDFRTAQAVDGAELEMCFADTTWHVLPLPIGGSGVARVIIGALLVAAIIAMPVLVPGGMGGLIFKGAVALTISGLASMLAPSPTASYSDRESPDQRPSYLFDGPTNRVAAGGAVPLVFGFNVFVGSTFLSGGLEIGDVA